MDNVKQHSDDNWNTNIEPSANEYEFDYEVTNMISYSWLHTHNIYNFNYVPGQHCTHIVINAKLKSNHIYGSKLPNDMMHIFAPFF